MDATTYLFRKRDRLQISRIALSKIPQIPLRGAAASQNPQSGGGKGIRTPGLFIANEALYQLSYTPVDDRARNKGGRAEFVKHPLAFRNAPWFRDLTPPASRAFMAA